MIGSVRLLPRLFRGSGLGVLLALCGFTTTTLDPDQAEVVTSDVDHFWQAFVKASGYRAKARPCIPEKPAHASQGTE